MRATDIQWPETLGCPARAPLRKAVALMVATPCQTLGVLGRDGRLLGHLTEHDVLAAIYMLGAGSAQGLRVAHALQLALSRAGSGVRARPTEPEAQAVPFELVQRRNEPVQEAHPVQEAEAPFELVRRRSEPEAPAPAREAPAPAGDAPPDDPLAAAFWLMSQLPWLSSPAEALDFCLGALERLVPAEASFAYLYDIDEDLLRLVATRGSAALEPGRHTIPRTNGFARLALRNMPDPLVLHANRDPAAGDGRVSSADLEARNAVFMPISSEERLLGLLQLVNRDGAAVFSDCEQGVIRYVAEQLAGFVSSLPPPAAPS